MSFVRVDRAAEETSASLASLCINEGVVQLPAHADAGVLSQSVDLDDCLSPELGNVQSDLVHDLFAAGDTGVADVRKLCLETEVTFLENRLGL
jgi:hypothetical protein